MSCHPPVKTEGRSVPWGRPGEYREYLQLNVGLSLLYLSPNFYYNIYYQQKKNVVRNFYRDLLLQNLKYSHTKAEILKNSSF